MITSEPINNTLEQQINRLQTEIATRKRDIKNLEEALHTLLSAKPRPANPNADDAFGMLKQLVGGVPEGLQEQRVYQAKLAEAQRALELAIAACKEKESELASLQQKRNELLADLLFQEVKIKADKFNYCVDEIIQLLSEIQQSCRQIHSLRGDTPLSGIYFEKREIPWCQVSGRQLVFKRKVDVR